MARVAPLLNFVAMLPVSLALWWAIVSMFGLI
jgi:hypothetical protein